MARSRTFRSSAAPRQPQLPAVIAGGASLPEDYARLIDCLHAQGMSRETVRKYRADLHYLRAWKLYSFDEDLVFPEREEVALRFIVDHSLDLTDEANVEIEGPRAVATFLIKAGLRRSLMRPAKSSLDRRIANWTVLHRWKQAPSPFDREDVKRLLRSSRRSDTRRERHKSSHPILAEHLDLLLAATGPGLRGLRDRALLETGWGSGGRRRIELTELMFSDLDLREFDVTGVLRIHMRRTKTHRDSAPRPLPLRGRSARALVAWLDAAGIEDGYVFRKVFAERDLPGSPPQRRRISERPLSGSGVWKIVTDLVQEALRRDGLLPEPERRFPKGYHASPHGLRSGYVTEASRRRIPLQVVMAHTLHRSHQQAARYYDEVDLDTTEAARMRD